MSDDLRDLFLTVELPSDRQADIERRVMRAVADDRKGLRGRAFAWIVGLVAVLSIGGVGVSTAWLISDRPDDPNIAWCYPTTDLDRPDGWGGMQVMGGLELPDGRRSIINAVDLCSSVWIQGIVHAPGQKVVLGKPVNPVPELTPCVLSSHETAVFPADARICSRLGLKGLNEDYNYPPHLESPTN